MSELQPTPIVDKNGKNTTVHKKRLNIATNRKLPTPATSVNRDVGNNGKKTSKVYSTLGDLYRAVGSPQVGEPTIAVNGADSSVPEGYLSATTRIFGRTGTYILKESSNDFNDAIVIGRVEYNIPSEKNSGNVYIGGNIKGGLFAGTFKGMDEAVEAMISNHVINNPDETPVYQEDSSVKTLGSLIRLAEGSMKYYPSEIDMPEGIQVVKAQIEGEERGYILKPSESDDTNDAEIIGYITYSTYTGLGRVYRGNSLSNGKVIRGGVESDKDAVKALLADIEHNYA